jgi:hypothetical protein
MPPAETLPKSEAQRQRKMRMGAEEYPDHHLSRNPRESLPVRGREPGRRTPLPAHGLFGHWDLVIPAS